MDKVSKPRNRWSLTAEAFETLLERLSPDRERAALEFEQHRRYLVTLLTYAGGADPEHLADTTLDRAAKRLAGGESIENIRAWLRGAARNVLLESKTELRREVGAVKAAAQSMPELQVQAEADHLILDQCLELLSAENRSLIERYYQHPPREASLLAARRRLSLTLGVSIENLRVRAMRVRKVLEQCLQARGAGVGEE